VTPPNEPSEPLERVVLTEEETVTRGRRSVVSYRVRLNDGWVRARSHPTARAEPLDRGPGVVYRTRIELDLPRGTLIERAETAPARGSKSTVDHLFSGSRSAGAPARTARFVVGRGGSLEPAK
jgi:hypothetical protein